ncbi:MAG: hypothetical protein ACYDHW_12730 [Syntrophorhabdaceae bacterium]
MKTEYVRQQVPDPPASPEYYPVTFVKKDGVYCASDEASAKNLLKNRVLDKGYQGELRGTLEDMKKGEGK